MKDYQELKRELDEVGTSLFDVLFDFDNCTRAERKQSPHVASCISSYFDDVNKAIDAFDKMMRYCDVQKRKAEVAYRLDFYGNAELCLNIMLGRNSFWDRKNPESDGLMTGDEYDAYIEAIRDALTADGNICDVDAQENLICIDGNAGGNLDRFKEILDELYARGCWLECDICVDDDGNYDQYETSLEAHLEELRERAKNF